MNSPYRSAASIIARSIAPATSELGGRRPASIQSRSPASYGKTPASRRGGLSLTARRTLPPSRIGLHNLAERLGSRRCKPDETAEMLTEIGAWSELFHTASGTA